MMDFSRVFFATIFAFLVCALAADAHEAKPELEIRILPEPVIAKFRAELDKAGYAESLIRGTDPVLNEGVRKMLQSIDIAAVAREAGL
jgi:hypothetical protein